MWNKRKKKEKLDRVGMRRKSEEGRGSERDGTVLLSSSANEPPAPS